MFGLEKDNKEKKQKDQLLDMEKRLENPEEYRKIQTLVEKKITLLKKILKEGKEEGEFGKFGMLLCGYTSILKTMEEAKKQA